MKIFHKIKSSKFITHAIYECPQCGLTWEDYRTSIKEAIAHLHLTGHTVIGQEGYSVTISKLT